MREASLSTQHFRNQIGPVNKVGETPAGPWRWSVGAATAVPGGTREAVGDLEIRESRGYKELV